MKKLFILTSLMMVFVLGMNAQTVPNPSFENWTNDSIVEGWVSTKVITFDTLSQNYTCASKCEESHSGTYSAKIGAFNFGDVVNLFGVFQLGEISIDFGTYSFSCLGGIPCTEVPAEIRTWVNYRPDGADTAMKVEAVFTKWNAETSFSDTIAYGVITNGATDSSFVELTLPINRISDETPDTMNLIYYSSTIMLSLGDKTTLPKTTLLIDDISISGVSLADYQELNVNVYPNPTSSMLSIECEQGSEINVFDSFGKVVYSNSNSESLNEISVENFANGNYFVRISNSGKISTKVVNVSK